NRPMQSKNAVVATLLPVVSSPEHPLLHYCIVFSNIRTILAKNEGLSCATVNFFVSGCSSAVIPCRGVKPEVRAGGTTEESTAEPLQRAAENSSTTAVTGPRLLGAWVLTVIR